LFLRGKATPQGKKDGISAHQYKASPGMAIFYFVVKIKTPQRRVEAGYSKFAI